MDERDRLAQRCERWAMVQAEADRLLAQLRPQLEQAVKDGTIPAARIARHLGWTRQHFDYWLKHTGKRTAPPRPEVGPRDEGEAVAVPVERTTDRRAKRVGDIRALTHDGLVYLWSGGPHSFWWAWHDGRRAVPVMDSGTAAMDQAASRQWVTMGEFPTTGKPGGRLGRKSR